MKKHIYTALLIKILFIPYIFGQVALDGSVDVNDYAGIQPDLIKGVSVLPATGQPLIRHVYLVDKNILALTLDEKTIIYSNLKPYHPMEGDTMIMTGYHGLSKLLKRNGEPIGYLCGLNNRWYRPFNQMPGKKLDVQWASQTNNYSISSSADSNYKEEQNPIKIYRKSTPNGRVHISLKQDSRLRHQIYLQLPHDLKPGASYTIKFEGNSPFKNDVSFVFDDKQLRTEALHVNMYGYEPNDKKIAFLSTWMGDGGGITYDGVQFSVINTTTKEAVYNGEAQLKQDSNKPEYQINNKNYNHNQTNVYSLDFSSLKEPGEYRVFVEGIGCSFGFQISDGIWENTQKLIMKGFLHQRSGQELGPPYTNYVRPRNMHTADGFVVHKVDPEKFFNPELEGGGQSSVFDRIQASILTDTSVPEAWGGWMDAGDFDQRMSHLYSVRRMMYLYELNPDYFEKLDLNIPESTNKIPDIIDEGLWCLELYRRTQGIYEEGGVSWWVESIEHPRQAETSWTNSLPTALIPPTPRASIHYAATAAQMSKVLEKYDPKLAEEYRESALAAMEWVEKNPDRPDIFGRNPRNVIENLAYVNLYRLTGDRKWHDLFLNSLNKVFPNGVKAISTGNMESIINYLLINDRSVDEKITSQGKRGIIQLADDLLAGAEEVAFYALRTKDEEMRRIVTMRSKVLPITIAHKISNDNKYLDALAKTMQYTMGANPMNRTYISGLGERAFMPYHHDWEGDNLHIPAGIPNFGPMTQDEDSWGWAGIWAIRAVEDAGLYPTKLIDWPFVEKCFNQMWIAPTNEFTVRSPMGEHLMLTGYLAQYYSKDGIP